MAYMDVREPGTKKLLFRFDPERELVEIKNRDRVTVVDLQKMKAPLSPPKCPSDHLGGGFGEGVVRKIV